VLRALSHEAADICSHLASLLVAADFEGSADSLGKPALADIRSGLATAPVLFAAQRFPVLLPLIDRKFEGPGDVEDALKMVAAADGLTATRRLAIAHGQLALNAIASLHPSPARTAMAAIVSRVLSRTR
jgi:geranylgeranyl pyrophosphate synthase